MVVLCVRCIGAILAVLFGLGVLRVIAAAG